MDEVGVRLKHLREAKKLSLRELGKMAHVSHSFIADIESGRSNPSLDTLKSLAKALNVSIVDLTGDVSRKQGKDVSDAHQHIEDALTGDPDADDLLGFWEELKKREDLFLLFKQVRPLSDDSIRRVIRIIKAIEDEEAKEFGD